MIFSPPQITMLNSDEPKYHCWPTLIVVTKAFKLVIKIWTLILLLLTRTFDTLMYIVFITIST